MCRGACVPGCLCAGVRVCRVLIGGIWQEEEEEEEDNEEDDEEEEEEEAEEEVEEEEEEEEEAEPRDGRAHVSGAGLTKGGSEAVHSHLSNPAAGPPNQISAAPRFDWVVSRLGSTNSMFQTYIGF